MQVYLSTANIDDAIMECPVHSDTCSNIPSMCTRGYRCEDAWLLSNIFVRMYYDSD